MWPQELEAWITKLLEDFPGFLGQDEWINYGKLKIYPPLYDSRDPLKPAWDDASWIAHEAAAQRGAIARGFHGHPKYGTADYIGDIRDFRLWLENIGYRQALRLILNLERVERELMLLPLEQKRLLYWRYLDRWDDAEIARTLRFTLAPQRLTSAEVQALSTQAHRDLCVRLRKAIPVGNRDFATFFPIFPGGKP